MKAEHYYTIEVDGKEVKLDQVLTDSSAAWEKLCEVSDKNLGLKCRPILHSVAATMTSTDD